MSELEKTEQFDPYAMFIYTIRSPYTKASYVRRLKRFFDFIRFDTGAEFPERCNSFVEKGVKDPKWAFTQVLNFLQCHKERVDRKEITAGTLRNSYKTIKSFCEITDIAIPWKKISKGLPREKKYAEDRAPTVEEIRKIIEYPDRRMKAIVFLMSSSGIRIGAWDYLKWKHVIPIKDGEKTVAAKIIVYAGEPDEYFTFVTPEAYLTVESWIKFRMSSGEIVTGESWVMRTLWNTLRPERNNLKYKSIDSEEKLASTGVKRLMERALRAQGIRNKLQNGKKRYEFQANHGLRKWFKTRTEMAGMRSINIEILMGHSLGISDSYYRVTEKELLEDYVKSIDFLTINNEFKLEKKVNSIIRDHSNREKEAKVNLYYKDEEIKSLREQDVSNSDAISALSEQIVNLTHEIELLKNHQKESRISTTIEY